MTDQLEHPEPIAATEGHAVWTPRDPSVATYTGLKYLKRSARHYLTWCNTEPPPPTEAMLLGSAAHHAILEPLEFARRYVVIPSFGDMRSSSNRARRDEWKAEQGPGKTFLTGDQYAQVVAMRDAVQAHPLARDLLLAGHAEHAIRWQDRDTGLTCAGRPDYVVEDLGLSIELKTCEDASPHEFGRACANLLYDLQGVMYLDGLRALGRNVREHVILAVEKHPPYEVVLYRLDDSALERGAMLMTKLLAQLRECVDTGEWPGYGEGFQTLTLPGWAFY